MSNAEEMLAQKLDVPTAQLTCLNTGEVEDALVYLDAEEAGSAGVCPPWLEIWRIVERCQSSAKMRKIQLPMIPQAIEHHREVRAWAKQKGLELTKMVTWLDGGAVHDPHEMGPGSSASWLSIKGSTKLTFVAKRKQTRASKFDDLARATSYVPCPDRLKAGDFEPPGSTKIRKFRGDLLIYRPIARLARVA